MTHFHLNPADVSKKNAFNIDFTVSNINGNFAATVNRLQPPVEKDLPKDKCFHADHHDFYEIFLQYFCRFK